MKTEASWKAEDEGIAAAKVLAEFANLDSSEAAVAAFREKHRDFFPPAWWDYRADGSEFGQPDEQWKITQRLVREAWEKWGSESELWLPDILRLFAHVFNPADIKGSFFSVGQPVMAHPYDLAELLPYHVAVKFLMGQSWRAKRCDWCKRHFIAAHPKARFCDFGTVVDGNETACFWAHRKSYYKESWAGRRKKTNTQRRKEYQSKLKPTKAKKRRKGPQGPLKSTKIG
jgi:hypothetical protein